MSGNLDLSWKLVAVAAVVAAVGVLLAVRRACPRFAAVVDGRLVTLYCVLVLLGGAGGCGSDDGGVGECGEDAVDGCSSSLDEPGVDFSPGFFEGPSLPYLLNRLKYGSPFPVPREPDYGTYGPLPGADPGARPAEEDLPAMSLDWYGSGDVRAEE